MKDHILEEFIQSERNRPLPDCPVNLESNVLRRIRLATRDTEEMGSFDWIFGLFPQKGVICGVLALTLFMSIASTMVVATNSAHAAETQSRAVTALDFGVFKETSFLDLKS
jgi:hypothetical protein